jgi:hypothetical protein
VKITILLGAIAVLTAALAGCGGPAGTVSESGAEPETATVTEALTACTTFTASADATISVSEMRKNFGTKRTLQVGERNEALLSFDLSSIPRSAVVGSATLKLYVSDADGSTIRAHRVAAPWIESTVTFASFAQHFDAPVVGSIEVRRGNTQKSVDVTQLAKAWVTGAVSNFGVLLESRACDETTLVSREGGTVAQKPALTVCYTIPDDHCSPNPCSHGGVCENSTSGFTCACTPGYAGATCDTNVDDCASNPCQNGGACTDGVASYTCACAPGFSGQNCETNIDDCANGPCQNGGVCEDGIATYSCHCPPGYTGAHCETLVDNCAANPCQNGGACTSGVIGYQCSCAPGFEGTNCEINIDDCVNAPCHNGGTCIDGVNAYACVCPPDWGGATCELNLNACSQHPCLNGGTCTNGFGNYTCSCAPGFTGTNCEIDINDCAPNPCQNDGNCVDRVNGYACTCQPGFSGNNCETIETCEPNGAPCLSPTSGFPGITLVLVDPLGRIQPGDECDFYAPGTSPSNGVITDAAIVSPDGTQITCRVPGSLDAELYSVSVRPNIGADSRFPDLTLTVL